MSYSLGFFTRSVNKKSLNDNQGFFLITKEAFAFLACPTRYIEG